MKQPSHGLLPLAALLGLAAPASAQLSAPLSPGDTRVIETDLGTILAADVTGTLVFGSWSEYATSDFFDRHGKRCGTTFQLPVFPTLEAIADCSSSFTNPASQYAPSVELYMVPVVVHVLRANNGAGDVSDALIHSQIDVLNEDFLAIAGTLGAPGTDVQIQFFLATVDPSGNPTTGITRHNNNQWFQDSGNYASAVGWDPTRYLNIYTNQAGGNLGYAYVPSGGGVAGQSFDGVRILYAAFGRNAPIGFPYDLGRTTTHEVGHYFGLYHTFQGGCSDPAFCYQNGDLVCDTNPESTPGSSSCTKSSCGSSDPTRNYMDYTYDVCMNNFTSEQARRMRCTLESFRVGLVSTAPNSAPFVSIAAPASGTSYDEGTLIGFSGSAVDAEDGTISPSISWSSSLDGFLGTGETIFTALSVGTHTVTASATDSAGATGSDSVSVTVNPVGGGGISLSGTSHKEKGRVFVDLSWSGATGGSVDVYRDGALVATTANDGAFTDATGLKGSGSIAYQVCEAGTSTCSAVVVVGY